MASTTLSLEQFQQDLAAAQKATKDGPVFVTEDGETRFVFATVSDFQTHHPKVEALPPVSPLPPGFDMAAALAMPDEDYFEWEPETLKGPVFHPVDFS